MISAIASGWLAFAAYPRTAFASGVAFTTIAGHPPSEVMGKVASACIQVGAIVEQTSDYQVKCIEPVQGKARFWALLLLGNRVSDGPYDEAIFQAAPTGAGSILQVRRQLRAVMENGEIHTSEIDAKNNDLLMQKLLNSIANSFVTAPTH